MILLRRLLLLLATLVVCNVGYAKQKDDNDNQLRSAL